MFDLDRFRKAQSGAPGIATALRELRAGAKTSHWIWFVFPQLEGLGRSSMAVRYGLHGAAEATAYLADPELGSRLATAAEAAAKQLAAGVPLDVLMGSDIDALKLVSSMTLFDHVARVELARSGSAAADLVARCAGEILRAAAAQGYPPCAFTLERLRAA
jgi:uncharacterized protein (DUF1810 family)